jgi:outer membrane protein
VKRLQAALTALLLLGTTPVFAGTVTLRQAIERALGNNHLLKAAELEKGAADEGAAASKSRYLPRLFLQSGATLSDTPSTVFMMKLDEGRINPATDFSPGSLNHPHPRGDFRSAVTLEQPLFDTGISTSVAFAGKDAEAAALSLEANRERVAFRVYLAYLKVRTMIAYGEMAEQSAADAREHLRLAGVRERDGIGLKSDQLRATTELAEAEQRLTTAKNDLLLARLRLNLAVGGAEGEPLDIEELPSLAEPAQALGRLAALARQNRLDLKLAENSVQKGELGVRQARTAYLPTLYASASYQLNDRDTPLGWDNDSWTVGLNLRWELFDGTRRSHEQEKARLSRRAAAELLENQRREVALEVTESELRRQEASLKLGSARAALQAAQEGMRLVTLRFRNGLSSMVELLDAEDALNRSRGNLVALESAYLGSVAEIYYRAGVFLKEVMQ